MTNTQDTNNNTMSLQPSILRGIRLSPPLNTIARLEKRRSKLYEVRDKSRLKLHHNENEIYYGLRFQCPEITPPVGLFIRVGLRCFEGIDVMGAVNRMDLDVQSRFTESMVKHRAFVMLGRRVDKRMVEVQKLLDAARAEAADGNQSLSQHVNVDYKHLNLDRFD